MSTLIIRLAVAVVSVFVFAAVLTLAQEPVQQTNAQIAIREARTFAAPTTSPPEPTPSLTPEEQKMASDAASIIANSKPEPVPPTEPPEPTDLKSAVLGQLQGMKKALDEAASALWKEATGNSKEFAIRQLKKIAMNLMPLLPPAWQVSKFPETKKELKMLVISWARLLLIDCANGEGFLAPLQPACRILVKGIPFGKGYLGILALKKDNSVSWLRMSGTVDLSGLFGDEGGIWDFQLEVNQKTNNVGMAVQVADPGARISILDIVGAFGDLFKNPSLHAWAASVGLDRIALRLNSLGFQFKPFGFRFKGTIELLGGKVFLNLLIVPTETGSKAIMIEFAINQQSIDAILAPLLGSFYDHIKIFEILALKFSLSTADIDLSPYPILTDNGQLSSFKRGLVFTFQVRFNQQSKNGLVSWLGKFFSTPLEVMLALNDGGFKLAAKLPDLRISKHVNFVNNLFSIEASATGSLSISVECGFETYIGNEKLLFTAKLSYLATTLSLQLKLSMIGWLVDFMSIKDFAIGNMYGSVVLNPATPPYVVGLGLGLEVRIGNLEKNEFGIEPIIAGAYFSINLLQPLEDMWVFARLKSFSMKSLWWNVLRLRTFPKWIDLLKISGTFDFSFSTKDTVTPSGAAVPKGLRLAGTLNLFGVTSTTEVIIAKTGVRFNLELGAFNFANGLLLIQRSPENHEAGPLVKLELTYAPFNIIFHLEGYISCFLFKAGVKIIFDDGVVSFRVIVQLFFIFVVDLEVTANIPAGSTSFDQMFFHFHAYLSTAEIKNTTRQKLVDMKDNAMAEYKRSIAALKDLHEKAGNEYSSCMNKCKVNCGRGMLELASRLGITANRDQETVQALIEQGGDLESSMTVGEMLETQLFIRMAHINQMSYEQMVEKGLIVHDAFNALEFEAEEQSRINREQAAFADMSSEEAEAWESQIEEEKQRGALLVERLEKLRKLEEDDLRGRGENHRGRVGSIFEQESVGTSVGLREEVGSYLVQEVQHFISTRLLEVESDALEAGGWGINLDAVRCKADKFKCETRCKWNRMKAGVQQIGLALKTAAEGVKQVVLATILKLVDLVVNNLKIDIRLEGNLGGTEQRADFLFLFNVTVAGANIKFELRLDVGRSGILAFAKAVLNGIKKWLRKTVPGGNSFVPSDDQLPLAQKPTPKPTSAPRTTPTLNEDVDGAAAQIETAEAITLEAAVTTQTFAHSARSQVDAESVESNLHQQTQVEALETGSDIEYPHSGKSFSTDPLEQIRDEAVRRVSQFQKLKSENPDMKFDPIRLVKSMPPPKALIKYNVAQKKKAAEEKLILEAKKQRKRFMASVHERVVKNTIKDKQAAANDTDLTHELVKIAADMRKLKAREAARKQSLQALSKASKKLVKAPPFANKLATKLSQAKAQTASKLRIARENGPSEAAQELKERLDELKHEALKAQENRGIKLKPVPPKSAFKAFNGKGKHRGNKNRSAKA